MTISVRSYGSVADVAGRSPGGYLNTSKTFDTTTNPTLTTVETYIDEISSVLNIALADQRFTVPVTQADSKKALGSLVNDLAADMCHASNSAGRFFSERALNSGLSAMAQIRKEIREWIESNAQGLEAIGAERDPLEDDDTTLHVNILSINRGYDPDGRAL
jgi:hypothetical protein